MACILAVLIVFLRCLIDIYALLIDVLADLFTYSGLDLIIFRVGSHEHIILGVMFKLEKWS